MESASPVSLPQFLRPSSPGSPPIFPRFSAEPKSQTGILKVTEKGEITKGLQQQPNPLPRDMPRRPNAAVPALNLRARRVCANGGDWQQPFGMDNTDWKTRLQRGSRQRIVNKIMETLRKHLPFSGKEGLVELKKIAKRFEEKMFTEATTQNDYLRKISLKMLIMEEKRLNTRCGSSSIEDGVPGMDNSYWKAQLQPGSRQRIVNKIVEILRKHLPFSGKEGLVELKNIAKRFEEKMYTEATTQSGYLQKISLKMLTMEKERSNSES